MRCLITWPTYGNWFAGHGRGGLDVDPQALAHALPEPTLCGEAVGQQPSRWPVVQLDAAQRRVVLDDLQRIASIRDFQLDAALAAPTFIHVLLRVDSDRNMNRLVQLMKGATARALTVAAGDELPTDAAGCALLHHKWWSRQYARLVIDDVPMHERVLTMLNRRAEHSDCTFQAESDGRDCGRSDSL